jgi:hypothetical protein
MSKKPIIFSFLSFVLITMLLTPPIAQAYVFNNQLDRGDRGEDVSALQQTLTDLGHFSYPTTTGFFGPITETALQAFQAARGIVSSGTSESTGYGRVGPQTLTELNNAQSSDDAATTLNNLLEQIRVLQERLAERQGNTDVATNPALGTPVNLNVTQRSNEVTLTWKQVPDATSYLVKRKDHENSYQTLASSTSTSYTDDNLTYGTRYYYTITAVNGDRQGSPSDYTYVFITRPGGGGGGSSDTTAPALPTGLSVTAGDATATVTWNDSGDSDLASIKIYRGTASGSLSLISTTNAGAETYTDEPLANDTIYYYALSAIDNSGNESPKTVEANDTPTGVFDIYVDGVNGDDANDGTSDFEAFATLGAAFTAVTNTYGNNTSIGLKAGSYWREEFDLGAYNDITIEGYGDLDSNGLPIVNGADIIDSGWQDSTDRTDAFTDTYSLAWTHGISANQQNGGPSVYEDNMIMHWQSSIADVDANPGSFYHDGTASDDSDVTLYVHPSNSANPETNGNTYEASKRDWVIRVGDDATVRLVEAKNPGHDNGSVNAGSDALIEKTLVYGSPIHDALFKSGTYKEVVAWHPFDDPRIGAIVLDAFDGLADGKTAIWDEVIVVGPPNGSVVGIGGHSDGDSNYANWIIQDSALSNSTISYKDVIAGTVTRTHLDNGSIQFFNDTLSQRSYTVTDPWCNNVDVTVADLSRCVWSRAGNNVMNINGLRSYTKSTVGPVIEGPEVNVEYSVAYEIGQTPGTQSWNFIKNTATTSSASWNNNIIVSTDERIVNLLGESASSSNNVLYSLSAFRLSNGSGGQTFKYTLADIQADHGLESGSLETDPELIDPTNGDFNTNSPIPNGAGLQRPNITYLEIPESLEAARAWILSQ